MAPVSSPALFVPETHRDLPFIAVQGTPSPLLSDLAGKLVSMDNRGSGTVMTATLLFSRLGIAIQPVFDATVDAAEKLRRGDIAPWCG